MRMAAITSEELTGTRTGTRAHFAHLAQVVAVLVEDDYAVVAVAVRNVHATALPCSRIRVWIHRDVRRKAKIL